MINSLSELRDLINECSNLCNSEHRQAWEEAGLRDEFLSGDYSDLPTFGGDAPANLSSVWSWDEHNLLVGDGPLEIMSREKWRKWMRRD